MGAIGWAALSAIFLSASAPASAADPGHIPAAPDPALLRGIWEVEGQALTIVVGPGEVVYYDTTEISCIESERGPIAGLAYRFPGGMVSRSQDQVVVRDHWQPYRLLRLSALPAQCRDGGTVGADPVLNFETFWHYLKENYAGARSRAIDWEAIHAEFRPQITVRTTADQLWRIYETILHRIDDVHTFISNGRQGSEGRSISSGRASGLRAALLAQNPVLDEDRSEAVDAEMQEVLNHLILYDVLGGRFTTALQDKFQWGWAAPGIGYLNIAMMARLFARPATDAGQVRRAVNETMDRMLRDFAGARAIIIDVRQNRGGSTDVAYQVAGHFADRSVVIRSRARTPGGFTGWWENEVMPHGVRFAGPVYLLISRNTVSAGEYFAMAMREFPNVTLVGENTRGGLSVILFKKMPDGGFLGIANEQSLNPAGENFEVRGISPDVRVPIYRQDRLIAGYRDAVDVAIGLAGGVNGSRR